MEIAPAVEASLRRLRRESVDLLLMAVAGPQHFGRVINDHLPELEKLKQQGKIRFLGSSEQTRSDGAHQWLQRMLPTRVLDVAMVGHNMLNQSAQRTVFPLCRAQKVGVLNVFTVRNLFWNPGRLRGVIVDLTDRGVVPAKALAGEEPIDWLLADGNVGSLVEAAYRYAACTDPVTTVMCGTIEGRGAGGKRSYDSKRASPAVPREAAAEVTRPHCRANRELGVGRQPRGAMRRSMQPRRG